MWCEQKYCKNCVKPVFDDKENKFLYGKCKISRYVVLETDNDADFIIMPLYCKY